MRKFPLFFPGILLLGILSACNSREKILWISSTDSLRWQKHESLMLTEISGTTNVISVSENRPAQVIEGFGGCFNELEWDALSVLDTAARDSLIGLFFGPKSDLKFNLCRVPIGANDYAMNWYSLDDTAGDFDMKFFTISRDEKNLIPFIRMALDREPGMKIWASPWCPPAWMKTNRHYACRMSANNDLKGKDLEGKEGVSEFIMEPRYLSAYALYFSKFIQAYRSENIPLYAVHVQNEPNSCQDFPSCLWKASDLALFIGHYLGPKLSRDVPDAEIWYGTIERSTLANIDTVLEDPEARKYVKGLGFQWAGKDAIGPSHDNYPGLPLMETESECGDGSNDWKAAEYTFSLMRKYFSAGAGAYMSWNMILDETGKSQWGWKQNSLVSVIRESKKIVFNPEYYLFCHVTHFVEPGARWLPTQGMNSNMLAFRNPDGTVVIILYNEKDTDDTVVISTPAGNFKTSLSPRSFNTFVYSHLQESG